mmetsp:Transcript_26822/g.63611  ORF Transcript_26822/g.63611 Transcript_26822/m.63611 type:complete len:810 (-) Transcript_26822:41-2470(-)|eukprot:CAMPEP_0180196902 /NCGR_PEP_ID=MMETSP0987-20121128/4352_1 /TAXON_ID=697907 /ORGANISM="non described non described, Strain CCMP2293" /LENGTH=809 /DNA_ID=CAMNT_0022151809 /DNA_START=40 /DNA_END=2469 /DNA_ORIENTATION=+
MRGAEAALCALLSLAVVAKEAAAFSGVSPAPLRDSRAARSPAQPWHGVAPQRVSAAAMLRPARLHAEERHRTRFSGSRVSMVAARSADTAPTMALTLNCPWTSADLPKFYNPTGKFDTVALYEGRLHNVHHFWEYMATLCPDYVALTDETHDGGVQITFLEAATKITRLAAALQSLGIKKGDRIGQFSENSWRWAVLDGAILKAGATNVVRGVAAPLTELGYIYTHSDAVACVCETVDLLREMHQGPGFKGEFGEKPRLLVVMYGQGKSGAELAAELGIDTPVVTMDELFEIGETASYSEVEVSEGDAATLLYTSGTTGKPKGVVLSHGNLMQGLMYNEFSDTNLEPLPGETLLSILPCWHVFERMAEYHALSRGAGLVYSSVKTFKKDLTKHRPHILVAVPRLFENLYDGVTHKLAEAKGAKKVIVSIAKAASLAVVASKRTLTNRRVMTTPEEGDAYLRRGRVVKALSVLKAKAVQVLLTPVAAVGDKLVWNTVRQGMGGRLKCLISGGSKLGVNLDTFFEMIGMNMIVGYGLTETSPVICNRVIQDNVPGSVGKPPRDTEILVKDVETGKVLGRMRHGHGSETETTTTGQIGVIYAKGPQVMAGYYKGEDEDRKAFDENGFFCTGDLGLVDPVTGALFLTGRAKDTIVLMNGENVEPQPIEEVLIASNLIDQVMLVGQDRKSLSALVVVSPAGLAASSLVDSSTLQKWQAALPGSPKEKTPDAALLEEESGKLNARPDVVQAVFNEVKSIIKDTPGLQAWESVGKVHLVLEPFTMENGLMTQTLKVKRDKVAERYDGEIEGMYSKK